MYVANDNDKVCPKDIRISNEVAYKTMGLQMKLENILLYGYPEEYIPGIIHETKNGFASLQDDLLFKNACPNGLTPQDEIEECEKLGAGFLKHGLHGAILATTIKFKRNQKIANKTKESKREPNGVLPPISQGEMRNLLNTGELEYLKIAADKYMTDALQKSVNLYVDALDVNISTIFTDFALLVLIIFIALSISLYFVLYSPLITLLDRQIKRTQAMLLMIPPDVLEALPELREYISAKEKKEGKK